MNCIDSVRTWLSDKGERSLSTRALVELSGYPASSVNHALHRLICDKKVERLGERGHYRFRLIRQR